MNNELYRDAHTWAENNWSQLTKNAVGINGYSVADQIKDNFPELSYTEAANIANSVSVLKSL